MSDELQELLSRAKAKVAAMTPAEKEAMLRAQRDSWVRGEMGWLRSRPKKVNSVLIKERE